MAWIIVRFPGLKFCPSLHHGLWAHWLIMAVHVCLWVLPVISDYYLISARCGLSALLFNNCAFHPVLSYRLVLFLCWVRVSLILAFPVDSVSALSWILLHGPSRNWLPIWVPAQSRVTFAFLPGLLLPSSLLGLLNKLPFLHLISPSHTYPHQRHMLVSLVPVEQF